MVPKNENRAVIARKTAISMGKAIALSDLEFEIVNTPREIVMLCMYCGQISPFDGGYVAGIQVTSREPAHLFYLCSPGCLAALYQSIDRRVVEQFINSEI